MSGTEAIIVALVSAAGGSMAGHGEANGDHLTASIGLLVVALGVVTAVVLTAWP